ncbi:hypothetical protein DYBT9623_01054 [Dyadobacter sp. CECT 9623]|uniref:Uncharacterized protein n=2 Tax=Dyadobacter linearis TaxID=2823330 RepID=A0ABM8ULG7_9BACT|nr:hypothetical protein DYBT9623_01054 [Dyadobacter sp. CECT 9623]
MYIACCDALDKSYLCLNNTLQMLDFEIDKLTNSIEHALTNQVFQTQLVRVLSDARLNKKNWVFDWKLELSDPARRVYKLVTVAEPNLVHGLISIGFNEDHVYMHLLENAAFNKGHSKLYRGVAGNLVAFACKSSFEHGFDGIVVFESKTSLIDHYKQTMGAKVLARNRLFIDTLEASMLVKRYFK